MKLSRTQKFGSILLLLVAVAGGSFLFRTKAPVIPIEPGVQFLPLGTPMPAQPMTWFERSVPISWSWMWRLRDYIRGPLAGILIDARIIDCNNLLEEELKEMLSRPPLAETNGLRGWILDDATLGTLGRKLEAAAGGVITRPRVQTSHGIQSSLSVGRAQALVPGLQDGLILDLLPLIHQDGTELITLFTVSEAVTNLAATPNLRGSGTATNGNGGGVFLRTNLAAAARWTVPDGTGFFMLAPPASNETRRVGVIVTAAVKRGK